jgi:hypothetical protein
MTLVPLDLPGSEDVIAYFGAWPSFHDAEVVSLELNRVGTSILRVHTFATTGELNSRGQFITHKHAIVSFSLDEIVTIQLDGFNHQNVIFGLAISNVSEGYEIVLDPCYGLSGRIVGKQLRVTFEPGIPSGSVYTEALR